MNLACCQFEIAWEHKEANFARVEALVEAASPEAGTLVLLPEMFATGFTMNAAEVAEAPDGPTTAFLAGLARRHAIWVQAGVVLRGRRSPRPRNEAVVLSPEGRLVARYAKRRLFSLADEPRHYAAGRSVAVFAWRDARVAPAVCYDLRFPELFRGAVARGAEILAVIACWPAAREEHWLTLLRARAIENQCYVAGANRVGNEPTGLAYSGRSVLVDPRGTILADAGRGERVIQAAIDLDGLRRYRREFPALRDMTRR